MKPRHLRSLTLATLAALTLAATAPPAAAVDITAHPKLAALAETMVTVDHYPRAELTAILTAARFDPSVVRAMQNQPEALPWHLYRRRFINADRVSRGAEFWRQHAAALTRATQMYGVPAAVTVALIGVETHFGRRLGNRRVLDALVTLSVKFPRRGTYFRRELRAFLNTTRAEGIKAESVRGSIAGAVGIPQFMPTSYQAYAVDFNQNGRRDLITEPEDAIGSVANYLKRHGWRANQVIVASVPRPLPAAAAALITDRAEPNLTATQLQAAGIRPPPGGSQKMSLLRLTEPTGDRHIIGFNNFHAITHYNSSINYAMAVVELSRLIKRRHGG